jgi:hypothetical protein
MGFKHLLDPL